jgi:hypothetical protein
MMPPHFSTLELDGTCFKLTGYTVELSDLEHEISLVDVDTDQPVPFTVDVDREREKRGSGPPRPGSVQYSYEMDIRISEVSSGRAVRLQFLDLDETFTVDLAEQHYSH